MKIIKRDGRAVEYHKEKIKIAIEKANKEVRQTKRASEEDIKNIIDYIEELGKKRMLVEDIQDIIEEKLMKIGKYELAKKYIVYRYRRALVRKQNTTDETILGRIRNENKTIAQKEFSKDILLATTQRDYIAGEVSRDLTKRLLLPEKIVKAHEEGILYFHDTNYFVQPIFNSCTIHLEDMLEKGTIINGKKIKTPPDFYHACMVTMQIIIAVANNQYGEQYVILSCLGKYLKKSYDKLEKQIQDKYRQKIDEKILEEMVKERLKEEVKAGIQMIRYQINTTITINGKMPLVTLFLEIGKEEAYKRENAMIIEEIIKQIQEENERKPRFVYILDETNNLTGGLYDDLTKLAIKCSQKKGNPQYMLETNRPIEGKFDQGIVSINLPQIGIISEGKEEKFWEEFKERLELCKEALMCRHYALLGTKSDVSPIHWQNGAISRLKETQNIDSLLYAKYSTISLQYIGLRELVNLMKKEMSETQEEGEGTKFAIKVIKYLKEVINKWKKETNIEFILNSSAEIQKECYRFAKMDKEKFGIMKGVTDKDYYTNSYGEEKNQKILNFEELFS